METSPWRKPPALSKLQPTGQGDEGAGSVLAESRENSTFLLGAEGERRDSLLLKAVCFDWPLSPGLHT